MDLSAERKGQHKTPPEIPKNLSSPHGSSRSSLKGFSWCAASLTALALAYALIAGLRTVGDPDLGWQMATGRWIVQHHRIPFTDVLSFTANGRDWVYPALSQVLLYCSYLIGGYSLLSWLGAAACIGTIAFFLRRGRPVTALLAVVAVPMIAARTPPRAEMFTEVLFAVFVNVLWHYHRSGRGPLWSLPLLMFLWVNLHLGFVAGLGMCVAYIFLELGEALVAKRRPVVLSRLRAAVPPLLATFAATLLNPWGLWNYVGMVRLLPIHSSKYIVELMSVPVTQSSIAQAWAWRDPESALWWLVAVAMVSVVFATFTGRIAPALLLGTSIYLVHHAIRFQGPFAAVVVVIGGSIIADALEIGWLGRVLKRVTARIGGTGATAVTLAFLLLVTSFVGVRAWDLISNRHYLRTPEQFSEFGPGVSSWYPEGAAAFLLHEGLPGNVFNDFNSGGFVAWRLSPMYPDYIDGRGDPFGGALFLHSQELLGEPLDSTKWQQEAETRDINTIIVSVDHEFGGGALSSLDKFCDSQRWRPVYLDPHGALFVRVTPATADLITRLQVDCNQVQFDKPPSANGYGGRAEQFHYYLNAAYILVVLNRNMEALEALERAGRIFSENGPLHYAKGVALQNTGHFSEAEQELRTSLGLGSDDAALALARQYDQQGRYPEEEAVLERVVARSAQPHWLYVKLGYAQLNSGRPRQALNSFDQAEKESPFVVDDAKGMGAEFHSQIAEGRRRALRSLAGGK